MFTNILDNAARYTATGGRTSVNVVRGGEKVRIDIADLGVGIAREALNRIFDMFTRVGRETPGTNDGLGIGLNLARRLAEMHDGEVQLGVNDLPAQHAPWCARAPSISVENLR